MEKYMIPLNQKPIYFDLIKDDHFDYQYSNKYAVLPIENGGFIEYFKDGRMKTCIIGQVGTVYEKGKAIEVIYDTRLSCITLKKNEWVQTKGKKVMKHFNGNELHFHSIKTYNKIVQVD